MKLSEFFSQSVQQGSNAHNTMLFPDRIHFACTKDDDMEWQWNNKVRAERRHVTYMQTPIPKSMQYEFEIVIPDKWEFGGSDERINIAEWHSHTKGMNGPLAFYIVDDEFWIATRYPGRDNWDIVSERKIQRGEPVKFEIDVTWSPDTDGRLSISRNGQVIFTRKDHPTCFDDTAIPFFKIGLYMVDWGSERIGRAYDLMSVDVK